MILDFANGRATQSKIMYNAYLSYNQLKEYLSLLIENNLLEYYSGTKIFRSTEKGLRFLSIHNSIGDILQTPPSKCDFISRK